MPVAGTAIAKCPVNPRQSVARIGFRLLHGLLRAMAEHPDTSGVLPALPVRETLKRVSDSWIESTVDREALWAAQTPQVFRLKQLRDAHQQAKVEGIEVTDDAGLLEATGYRVRIIPGDLENLKVTYPEDQLIVERFFRERELS